MPTKFPQPLQPNATIGVIAPSGSPDPENLEKGIHKIEAQGYRVRKAANLGTKTHFTAGTYQSRMEESLRLFLDENIDGIICARGGDGGIHLLPEFVNALQDIQPVPFIGYSDITLFQLALYKAYRWVTFSGPMVATELGAASLTEQSEQHYWELLTSPPDQWKLTPRADHNVEVLRDGEAEGPLLGGCLALVCTLLGTEHLPEMDRAVLIVEDIDEEPRHIDRMLHQLRLNGIFGRVSGLILGQFQGCFPEDPADDFTLRELVLHATRGYDFPILTNFPYGHATPDRLTIPIGAPIRLTTNPLNLKLKMK